MRILGACQLHLPCPGPQMMGSLRVYGGLGFKHLGRAVQRCVEVYKGLGFRVCMGSGFRV